MSKNIFHDHRIPSSQISVVIQGPLYRNLQNCDLAKRAIDSIRQHLPEAQIIISTWENENARGLHAEQILFQPEPPCFKDRHGNQNNVLRQIISTQKGIAHAKRPYILKFRADHALVSPAITVIRDYSETLLTKRLFKNPITVSNFFTRNPVQVPMLFHLSDLVQFGLAEDMRDLWYGQLPRHVDVFLEKPAYFRILGQFVSYSTMKLVPEQFLLLNWLKKHGYSIDLPYVCYTDYALFKLSEQILIDHFTIIDWQKSGILFPKRFHYSFYSKKSLYTEQQLQAIKKRITGRYYKIRYLHLFLNKYLFCWGRLQYWHCFASTILFSFSPKFASYLRMSYKSLLRKLH